MVELLALGWVLGGHRHGIDNIKRYSSNKELLSPNSELSLSCNPYIVVLTFKSKSKGQIFLKGTSCNMMCTETIPCTPMEGQSFPCRPYVSVSNMPVLAFAVLCFGMF